jgi:hypothetical protein
VRAFGTNVDVTSLWDSLNLLHAHGDRLADELGADDDEPDLAQTQQKNPVGADRHGTSFFVTSVIFLLWQTNKVCSISLQSPLRRLGGSSGQCTRKRMGLCRRPQARAGP